MNTKKYFSSSNESYLQIMQQHYAEAGRNYHIAYMLMTALMLLVSITLQHQLMTLHSHQSIAATPKEEVSFSSPTKIAELSYLETGTLQYVSNTVPTQATQTNRMEETVRTILQEDTIREVYVTQDTVMQNVALPKERIENYEHTLFALESSVLGTSKLDAEQIDLLLAGTKLEGIGSAVKEIEDLYNINAYYTIAVATLESGHGTSVRARTKNNIFGLQIDTVFKSYSDCVYYFGRLMEKYQVGYELTMTTAGINPTYCEKDDWAGKVTTLMNQYVKRANTLF